MPLNGKTLAVIGAGNMGEALIRGLLTNGAMPPQRIVAADLRSERRALVSEAFGIRVLADSSAAVSGAEVVLLAVKPQQMSDALSGISNGISHGRLIVSIAAGVKTTRIERELGGEARVVRVMPNTPAQIGLGAAAIAAGRYATEEDLRTAEHILNAVGSVVRTEERMMDAVTALSGTGPAYVFLLAEAMIRAGEEMGLGKDLARRLTIQTVLGSAKLMAESGEEPELLRHKVTSPGGTTEAALRVMSEGGLVDLFVEAVKTAARRSQELSGR